MNSTAGGSTASRAGVLTIRHSSAAAETINLDSLAEVEGLLVSLLGELLLESESTSMHVLCELLQKQQWCLSGISGHEDSPDSTHSTRQESSPGMPTPHHLERCIALLVYMQLLKSSSVTG